MSEKHQHQELVKPITTTTNPAKMPVESKSTEVTSKEHRAAAYMPSQSTVNTVYKLSRSANRVHQLIDPSSADWDDDDDDDDDNDDDDDSDDENDEDDDEDEDGEDIDDLRHGDEPLSEQDHHDIASQHSATPSTPLADAISSGIEHSRDPTAVRYNITPAKVEPEPTTQVKSLPTTLPTSTPTTSTPAVKTNPASTSTTSSVAGPKASAVTKTTGTASPKVTPLLSPPPETKQPSPSSQPPSGVSTAKPAQATTSPSSTAAPRNSACPAPAKVDPLAPTAAAPYGYKIVTVRKPDGTTTKVKRPLKEGEKAPEPATKPAAKSTKPKTQPTAEKKITTPTTDPAALPVVNEKATTTLASTEISSNVDNVKAAPTPTPQPAALKEVSANTTKAPQVTEKELEEGSGLQPAPAPTEEWFKGARTVAKVIKFVIWVFCILLPLFFLGK